MEEGALNVDTRFGTLTVNSLLLAQSWVTITDPTSLLDLAELRGGDRLVPHAVGVLARRRRRTATRKDFPFAVTGLYTPGNVRVASRSARYQQLIDNMEAVEAGLDPGEDAPAGVTGTVTALWTHPNGGTKSGPAHVLTPLRLEIHKFVAVGVLSLSIPAGRLA